eukprot:424311-Amphidinium_carterae.1
MSYNSLPAEQQDLRIVAGGRLRTSAHHCSTPRSSRLQSCRASTRRLASQDVAQKLSGIATTTGSPKHCKQ